MNIIGINVSLPDTCRCASDIAIVRAGDATHHLSLKCRRCERHRGWLSKPTADWILSVVTRFGASAAITIRSSAIAKACAKQDETLKRKYTPTGKSWFDVITETFEVVPSPSGTGEEQDFTLWCRRSVN